MSEAKRILLVEDSAADVELTLEALGQDHLAHEVMVVRDGAAALDYLYRRGEHARRAEGHPAVVLLDLKMPRVDGLQVLRQVKGDETLRHVPIVMLTSSREDQDLFESYRLGANGYVVKPVDFARFVEALKQLVMFWAVVNEPPPGSVRRSF